MKQKVFAISLFAVLTSTGALADTQQSSLQDTQSAAPQPPFFLSQNQPNTQPNNQPATSKIESTNAGGERQTTVVDENGNLKMVDRPTSAVTVLSNTPPTNSNKMGAKMQGQPGMTTPGNQNPATTTTSPGMMHSAPTGSAPQSLMSNSTASPQAGQPNTAASGTGTPATPPSSTMGPPSAVMGPPSTVINPPSTVINPPSTVINPPSTMPANPGVPAGGAAGSQSNTAH